MKEVFVVVFTDVKSNQTYVDSVYENKEEAQKYVNKMNEWECFENGSGDFWFMMNVDYHAK